jgi:hypothetical protein
MNLTQSEEDQPTADELAEMCGVSLSTFQTAAKALEEEGTLIVIRKSGDSGPVRSRFYINAEKASMFCSLATRNATRTRVTRNYVTHNTLTRTNTLNKYIESERNKEEETTLFTAEEASIGAVTPQWVVDTYSKIAAANGLPGIRHVSPIRIAQIQKQIKHFPDLSSWEAMFARLAVSKNLAGKSWFSLTFILESPNNFEKVTNGWMDWEKEQPKGSANKLPADEDFHSQLTQQGRKHAL